MIRHLVSTMFLVAVLSYAGPHGPALHGQPTSRESDGYTSIDVPGASDTVGQGVNDRGDIVGGYTSNGVSHGFLSSRGTFTTVDFPGADSGFARGINRRGDIVGLYSMSVVV
jgi:hypothetical protein